MYMKKYIGIIVFFIFVCSTAIAQQITAQKIMQNLKEHFDAVKDYTVTLDIKPNIERFNTKEMHLRLYYKQPDKVHIESKGFVMIPRQLFETNPAQLLSKFDPILIETKKEEGKIIYVLRLVSKPEKNHPALENYITVDGERWIILKLRSIPAEGRTIDITFEYTTVDNTYILPSLMNASFNFGNDEDSIAKMKGFKGMPTKGTIEIRYSDYVVNSGLSDEIFEKKEKK
jgi:outer membrane lipoprotein-sorting protein